MAAKTFRAATVSRTSCTRTTLAPFCTASTAAVTLGARRWSTSMLAALLSEVCVTAASNSWAQIQLLASTAQWQALLGALTPELQQQYPQQALALEAHAAQQLGQTDRALQVYQRWTERSPQDSRAWLGLATSLDQSGQWPKAQQAYQQALQLGGLTDASRQFIQQRLQPNT